MHVGFDNSPPVLNRRAVVKTVIIVPVPQNAGEFLNFRRKYELLEISAPCGKK